MGDESKPLKGFSWRGGSERDTNGILMWSEVFLHDTEHEEFAIILLDTQGTFDSQSTTRDSATIFGLSTLLSSVQVYNLRNNIQEDNLQHLQLFTSYGQLALKDNGVKPFQCLQVLVRDWSPHDHEYGALGGDEFLQKRLTESGVEENQSVRQHLKSTFEEIGCFLMPHPGLKVANDKNFDGRLAHIETEFKDSLNQLVDKLLHPKNLKPKKINGQSVTADEFVQVSLHRKCTYFQNEN
jgi:atlastin